MGRLTDRLVGGRVLFYLLLLLYIAGIVLGGRPCMGAAALVAVVPISLVLVVVVESARDRDWYTAVSGLVMVLLLIAVKAIA